MQDARWPTASCQQLTIGSRISSLKDNNKKDTIKFFQNNTLYRDVKDKMLEQKVPQKNVLVP